MKHLNQTVLLIIIGFSLVCANCGKTSSDAISTELLPLEGNPLVCIKVVLNNGSADDPAGKEGLSALTFRMLSDGGSEQFTYKEISEKFYPMAAFVDMQIDKEMTVFSGTIHKDNLEEYYSLFKDMLLKPGFREEDFIRIKTNHLNFLQKTLVNNMDEQFGKEILNLMMYEEHPYGHTELGTVKSVKGLTLDDVKNHYENHFVQGNVTIGIAGGYPSEFPKKIVSDFSSLPQGSTPELTLPEQQPPDGLQFVIADKSTPATAISMGFPIPITKAHPDYFALWIAGSHFGEHRQHLSHLFQKIREERGQNYGDYAYIEHFIEGRGKFPETNYCRQQQYFSIWIRPLSNSNRHFVLRQAIRELKKLVQEGIPPERFELTKKYLVNYTKLYTQTLSERLGWHMDSTYYGYKSFLEEAHKQIPKVKIEEVNSAIKKYLNFKNLYIAVVTQDAESFKENLIANTPSPITYSNPNMPEDILTEDLIIQEFPLVVNPENVITAKASRFFQEPEIPEEKK
ncbi:MAG: insulinase family protein [Candidatus Aminicenantes bacterium]|nr:insulinase family protein [Candidatus Aminicenantes bacterium]